MKKVILPVIIVLIAGSIFYLQSKKSVQPTAPINEVEAAKTQRAKNKATRYELAKEISSPDHFLNTPSTSSGQAAPITIGEFTGKKVVLLDFWTYSCINCQRTIPYLNAWHEKYKDKGLVIIGVHTPEFEFEKKQENVAEAVKKFGIKYPVVMDNDFSTWTSYGNRYWPRKYLIDIDGYIAYDHIGEGGYEETEKKIQELLNERMAVLAEVGNVSGNFVSDVHAPQAQVGSPEVYFGASRNEFLGNGKRFTAGAQTFSLPAELKSNILYLEGEWDITEEYAEALSPGAKILFRYNAKETYFVASAATSTPIIVKQDGQAVNESFGEDVSKDGKATISEDRLYKLIKNPEPGEHLLEIIIEKPGLKAFTFTFG